MPDWKPEIRARLSSVRLAPARGEEIVEELSQHLDDRCRELVAAGATAEEAERIARGDFSHEDVLAPYLSALRQARSADPAPSGSGRPLSLQGLGADLRHSLRGLRTAPSFAIAALLVLALGIGATTAIFAVVDAVVLRGLPFDDADRIVAVGERIAMTKGAVRSIGRDAGGVHVSRRRASTSGAVGAVGPDVGRAGSKPDAQYLPAEHRTPEARRFY